MKTFTKMAAQGDFVIIRIDELPKNLATIEPEGQHHVVAHSETGHNHVMEAAHVDLYAAPGTKAVDLYELFAVVKESTPIDHLRSFDTHESILVPPGNYKIVRQREYTPEGFRKAAD